MKTIFAQHQDNGGNNVAGVFPLYARKCRAISQTTKAGISRITRALVADSLGAHWLHWLKTFRRVCAAMQNCWLEPPASQQSNQLLK